VGITQACGTGACGAATAGIYRGLFQPGQDVTMHMPGGDLIINLEETSTADITFGIAFGGNQDYPVSAQIQWQDRNFLGRGQTFGIQGIASPINQQISFNFLERWLFGRRWSGGLNLLFERSVINNVLQDAIPPVYADEESNDAPPDPFSNDDYVFTEDGTSYGGTTYDAGDRFPGVPTGGQISDLNLEREYDYVGGSLAVPTENLMSYDQYSIRLAANTGYTFRTPVGRFVPRTSLSTGITYITYDDELYRPADETTRNNLNEWQFVNSWSLGAALDARDYVYSPSSGYRLDQELTFVGGFLGGSRHFARSESTAETFFTLWDVPLGEWSWKMVLGLQSKLTFILPNFYLDESNENYFEVSEGNLLAINGFFNARGWPYEPGGSALWNNWVELRMPLSEQIIWWDAFFEAAALRTFESTDAADWDNRERLDELTLQDWYFTIGTGIRFVIPQFPIRLYLARRFKYDESGNLEWQTGNLFSGAREGRGLDLVFAIGAEFF
jgi:outer membrane protein insertion porin family